MLSDYTHNFSAFRLHNQNSNFSIIMNLMCPFIFGKNCIANTFKTQLRNMNSYETNIPISRKSFVFELKISVKYFNEYSKDYCIVIK